MRVYFYIPQPPNTALGPASASHGPTAVAAHQQAAHIGSKHQPLSRLLAMKRKGLIVVNYKIYTITLRDID